MARVARGLFAHFVRGLITRFARGLFAHFVRGLITRVARGLFAHFVRGLIIRLAHGLIIRFAHGFLLKASLRGMVEINLSHLYRDFSKSSLSLRFKVRFICETILRNLHIQLLRQMANLGD